MTLNPSSHHSASASGVLFGIDRLLASPGLVAGRIGLVTNAAARTARTGVSSRVALQQAGFRLERLFSPEHGLQTTGADGLAMGDSLDSETGLPVISLYGSALGPTRKHLNGLESVLFDIPDIGTRFYTYIWTLWHVLEACAEAGKPLVVLDRPNPLGGDLTSAEGPILDVKTCGSFLGRAPIPVRHSLTAGELTRLWNREQKLTADVRVIPCSGWNRSMHWPDTGRDFVRTSPAMSSYESALLYPGLCLFEATNLSVGRGTDHPFQIVGAPWLQNRIAANGFNALSLRGVTAEPQSFVPSQPPYQGERCFGLRLRLTEPKRLRPVAAGLHLLTTIIATHPKGFRWTKYPTAANPAGTGHFERLIGRCGVRELLENDAAQARRLIPEWTSVPSWPDRVKEALLYEEIA